MNTKLELEAKGRSIASNAKYSLGILFVPIQQEASVANAGREKANSFAIIAQFQ